MLSHNPRKPHQIFVQFPSSLDLEAPWHALADDNTHMLAQSLAGIVRNPWDQIVLGFGCHFSSGIQIAQTPISLNSSLKQIEMLCHRLEGHIEDDAHDRLILQIHRFLGAILTIKDQFYPEQNSLSLREKARLFLEKWMAMGKPPSAFVLSAPIAFEAESLPAHSGRARAGSPAPWTIVMAPSNPRQRLLRK